MSFGSVPMNLFFMFNAGAICLENKSKSKEI
jgi:hypothetical protein